MWLESWEKSSFNLSLLPAKRSFKMSNKQKVAGHD